jgi:nucleoside-diphosphate-sugar epimerase
MVAQSFASAAFEQASVVVYASGVSNSDCVDMAQFERERRLLSASLADAPLNASFIYFGTCSVYDPDAQKKAYVRHKLEMEAIVLSRVQGRVIRLPQIAGPKAPPNTLIAALVSKVRSGEQIQVWQDAVRNVIDIEDVVKIVCLLASQRFLDKKIINVANPVSISVMDLVRAIESCLHISSRIELVKKGSPYDIDTSALCGVFELAGVEFGPNYLVNLIKKYYL